MTADADAPATLTRLLQQAEQAGASDVHLQRTREGAAISFRLDGVLTPVTTLPAGLAEHVFGRIKFLARLKTYDDSLPQDGRIDRADAGTARDIRVATYPTVTGEKIVLRLFNQTVVRRLTELELPADVVAELEMFLRGTTGLLLLTGPAGSGKTTTIYACLRQLLDLGGRHIITVEDPVEQILPGVMQTEVNEPRGLSYPVAARHLLRQDPQVLVLGEIRDDETAHLAVRAALTGHLVISTLHAGSCRGVFERLFVMCPDRYAVAAAAALVVNQRLLRRRCAACAGAGCDTCTHTGYRGRVPVVEWVRVDAAMRARLRAGDLDAVVPAQTLAASARELLERGLSDSREYERVLGQPPE
jgi:type II secretory ATPase GspE/PulE/Tfp pilus assembly ATPase PilB-like protein